MKTSDEQHHIKWPYAASQIMRNTNLLCFLMQLSWKHATTHKISCYKCLNLFQSQEDSQSNSDSLTLKCQCLEGSNKARELSGIKETKFNDWSQFGLIPLLGLLNKDYKVDNILVLMSDLMVIMTELWLYERMLLFLRVICQYLKVNLCTHTF